MNNILIIHNPYSGNQKNFDIIKDSLIKIGKDNNYYMGTTISKKTDQDTINNIKDIIQNNKYEIINIIKYNTITISPTPGIIRDIILNENISNLDIQYKDGNKGKITLDYYGNICPEKTLLLTIPSIYKKFPDQVENHYKR